MVDKTRTEGQLFHATFNRFIPIDSSDIVHISIGRYFLSIISKQKYFFVFLFFENIYRTDIVHFSFLSIHINTHTHIEEICQHIIHQSIFICFDKHYD